MNKELLDGGLIKRPSYFFKKLIPLIGLLLAGIVYYILYRFEIFSFPCPLRFWTSFFIDGGITCPGCGVTRMLSHEINLQFKEAFGQNQAVFILQPLIYFEVGKLIFSYLYDKKVTYSKYENALMIVSGVFLIGFCIWRNIIALS